MSYCMPCHAGDESSPLGTRNSRIDFATDCSESAHPCAIVARHQSSGGSATPCRVVVAPISTNRRVSQHHSISIFLTPPTSHNPRCRIASLSLARIIVRSGRTGLFGSTCEASFAACSMASISSLQACWSMGHTTIGWRNVISLAEVMCAWNACEQHGQGFGRTEERSP